MFCSCVNVDVIAAVVCASTITVLLYLFSVRDNSLAISCILTHRIVVTFVLLVCSDLYPR